MRWNEMMVGLSARTGVATSDCRKVVDGFLKMIVERLDDDDSVVLKNFGTFVVYQGKDRSARNPRTGVSIKVPARRRVRFRVSRLLKNVLTG